MPSEQERLRDRVVKFYEMHADKGKMFTVNHFTQEGKSKRTIYSILQRKIIKREVGSGRKANIMTGQAVRKLTQLFDNKDNISQRDAARKFNCSQQHISKVLKKHNIVPRRKQRAPSYTPDQIQIVKLRWMCNQYRG